VVFFTLIVPCFRYKVFIDLFNLTTFLVPRQFIPPLTQQVTARGLLRDVVVYVG
jgi:hypothetical protein